MVFKKSLVISNHPSCFYDQKTIYYKKSFSDPIVINVFKTKISHDSRTIGSTKWTLN